MKRVLLKLSGEALAGNKKTGFDEDTVLAIAKQKVEQIRVKADELVSQAVATSQPHVEQAAQELRKSAIAVTKDVLAKLEKEEA